MTQKAIVIGAGILGLATARALSLKEYAVTVIESGLKATGASIRNFGMIWPVGQPSGKLYDRALISKNIWKQIADQCGLWYNENGSLHLAYHEDEWQVLKELNDVFNTSDRPVKLMSAADIALQFKAVKQSNLIGGLFSPVEMVVDPREALVKLPQYFKEHLAIQFIWGARVTKVAANTVFFDDQLLQADIVCICSGADFETLFPHHFKEVNITKCKLQMLRYKSNNKDFNLGTSVCGGLSLIHYKSFLASPSLALLQQRYQQQMPDYIKHGIHVMVSQNGTGELTVGDSHEYGLSLDPFDRAEINNLIIAYLNEFIDTSQWRLIETWNGIYPKMLNGDTDVVINPEAGVYILNGLGGAGMTLSFGFAEEVVGSI